MSLPRLLSIFVAAFLSFFWSDSSANASTDQRVLLAPFVAKPVLVDDIFECAEGLTRLRADSPIGSKVSDTGLPDVTYQLLQSFAFHIKSLGGSHGEGQAFMGPGDIVEVGNYDLTEVFQFKGHPDGVSSRCGEYAANLTGRVGLLDVNTLAQLYLSWTKTVLPNGEQVRVENVLGFFKTGMGEIADDTAGEIVDCMMVSNFLKDVEEFGGVDMLPIWSWALSIRLDKHPAEASSLFENSSALSGGLSPDNFIGISEKCLMKVIGMVQELSEATQ